LLPRVHQHVDLQRAFNRPKPRAHAPTRRELTSLTPHRACKNHTARHRPSSGPTTPPASRAAPGSRQLTSPDRLPSPSRSAVLPPPFPKQKSIP
jgi:hypothetical protein